MRERGRRVARPDREQGTETGNSKKRSSFEGASLEDLIFLALIKREFHYGGFDEFVADVDVNVGADGGVGGVYIPESDGFA